MNSAIMSRYKLIYFNATWLGEPIRFILRHQGIPFEEIRHTQETFEAAKKNYPIQHAPVLEIDGKTLFQSASICRHLANKFGLAGANNDEKVAADIAVDTVIDLRGKIITLYSEADADIRAAKAQEVLSGHGPIFLTYLNDQAKRNGEYLVGGKLTWADLFFSAEYDIFLKYLGKDVFDKYSALVDLNKKVRALPNIKKWIETRPVAQD